MDQYQFKEADQYQILSTVPVHLRFEFVCTTKLSAGSLFLSGDDHCVKTTAGKSLQLLLINVNFESKFKTGQHVVWLKCSLQLLWMTATASGLSVLF